MKAKQVLLKGSSSASKGGNRAENEISDIVPKPNLDGRTMTSGVVLDRRLSKVKGVTRRSSYPTRRKPHDQKENTNPNMVDVGEWARELSKLSELMPSENGDTRSIQLVETNSETDGHIGNVSGLEKIKNSS
ncbi:hypothetical protein V6N13_084170 [Hibiscus sabdariffa]|uniref:Uncharacterized protein n=1 Tax=Hibiscus sabdariffa TaxID=183260 RepID=A0ABR2T0S5_9ROSI